MRLLIVEDNSKTRRMIRSLVAVPGAEILECADGLTAVGFYRRFRPDWVLMDIQMPELDGLSATRRIVELDRAARVVIVTNFDEIEIRDAAAAAGACGFVLKRNLLELRNLLRS
ncbi:MAG: response regulator [Acidobacteria bacterium]|nr:response regulator [Acidobacteriota bacterium]